jgi:4-hydroxy-tetrahydrodipicolinate synthase
MEKDMRSTGQLEGCYVAMITPFTEEGRLDLGGLRELIDFWIGEGVHGLIPSGSTGEFLQLTDEERSDLIRYTVEFAAGRVPVVAGASADWTDEAIAWTRLAESVGASGVMVVAPYYSRPTPAEIIRHYRAIGDATSLPIMVYNNPETTGVDMQPPLLAELSWHPNLRYVKESTRDVRRVEEIIQLSDGRMHVFAGILAHESFLVGATGWVSVPANVVPRLSARMFELDAWEEKPQEAAATNRLIWGLMALEDATGKYVQIPKAALAMMNRPSGSPRPPRLPLTDDESGELRRICEALGLLPSDA